MTDRATDAWGVLLALVGKNAKVVTNIAVALAYAATYLALREASNDQWYLPAGLRFASLLITPGRLWPALFAGDVLALATFRHPLIEQKGLPWYVGASLVVWPVAAMIVRYVRARGVTQRVRGAADAVALVVAAFLTAEAVSFVNKACSAWLVPNSGPLRYGDLIVYSLGDLQGILIAVFAVLIINGKCSNAAWEREFRVEAVCAGAISIACGGAIVTVGLASTATLDAARLLLLVPAIVLSVRRGWRGACVGSIASNIALFWTVPHQEAGQHDGSALIMQEAFVFLSSTLFIVGARIHERAVELAHSSAEADQARRMARAQFDAFEAHMRDKALRTEAMHKTSRGSIEPVIAELRRQGKSEVAMSLIGMAHSQSAQFSRTVVDSIYPLTIERSGLFAALNSEAFLLQFGDVECALDLTGVAHALSLSTQLAAYRVIGDAIEYLASSSPKRINLRVRCTCYRGCGHVSIALTAFEPAVLSRSSVDTARLARLRGRASAYDGSFHNRRGRLRVMLLDSPVDPVAQSPALGHADSRPRALV